ncbi:UDP-N-acetylmuramoyl-L-alanyl-D-glutamate--2,6-diaminopimelate ligase [Candidatus Blochmanniella vafra str. BVAF]|uniref:UDP-N-acetylmuramoyl-L-alanyl-D-glutamate--2,6-diaminopimelate ligase n=1 Tax=Blochmanniella vafra (strain BVAF) TaxID=859654 RepID=E8Q5P8_BLOVB|nr:UDP-N-acetylmuramoyl-L-alanyl-D-glutamate--2,6-diaminopimelate ligase [Candidatus Blochmannia vafer]ADV33545.1 UDP-N-acetylmuramoyl-L-alanyl-D-glutamate--2,6-diaminopimelate ligase [Candidatus Blochmannia vafer str. BVAF]
MSDVSNCYYIFPINKLRELVIPWVFNELISSALVITALQLDSRNVTVGNLFIAIKGHKTDGRLYIKHAIKNGAVAVLLESTNNDNFLAQNIVNNVSSCVPIINFYKLNQAVSSIAGRFYGHPSRNLNLIGVTGTNGKTTISHLLANWVELLGEKSAVMGTIGYGMIGSMCVSNCTTFSAIDTQRILNQFIQSGIKFVAMEVSSHGLDQYRVDALYFDVAIFSNLTSDHLDYHGDINKYIMAKWRLFSELCVTNYVINVDDYIGYEWLSYLPNSVAVTIQDNLPKFWKGEWIKLVKANYFVYGTDVFFHSSWGNGIIRSQLLGECNVSNLLLALGALLVLGYPLMVLLSIADQLKPICGRLEKFKSFNKPTIIVDYAHTPDALEKILRFLGAQLCKKGKLWCVFGCGGNRDKLKRSRMGIVAERYSDYVVITDDNPRTENSQSIIDDIILKIKHSEKITIIKNRVQAIETAICQADSNDFILIAGKGHESYQIVGNDYLKYSDQDIVRNILENFIT